MNLDQAWNRDQDEACDKNPNQVYALGWSACAATTTELFDKAIEALLWLVGHDEYDIEEHQHGLQLAKEVLKAAGYE